MWNGYEVELKSFERPRYDRVADEIQSSVERALTNHGVTKDTFIVYSHEHPPVKSFLRNIAKYNQCRPDATIKRLYWWDGTRLQPLIDEATK